MSSFGVVEVNLNFIQLAEGSYSTVLPEGDFHVVLAEASFIVIPKTSALVIDHLAQGNIVSIPAKGNPSVLLGLVHPRLHKIINHKSY